MLVRSILGGLVCGGLAACLVDLPHHIACGDGYVDVEAGEDCDPQAPRDEWSGCGEWTNRACDPQTCACLGCGNGEVEREEECDVGPGGGAAAERPCAGSELGDADPQAPLRPGPDGTPYASGTSTRCNADCTYDRSECGYCGNGEIDPPRPLSLTSNLLSREEVCDGDEFDRMYLNEIATAGQVLCGEGLRHVAACAPDCRSASIVENTCCVQAHEPCLTEGTPCCSVWDHPEFTDDCTLAISAEDTGDEPDEGDRVCR